VQSFDTSTGTSEIITDGGRGYIKALGNKEGPHVLAADWIATRLADWLGLKTACVALMTVLQDDEIPLGNSRKAAPGTAFVSRALPGETWQGTVDELRSIDNPETLGLLVVCDTWLRNCDRHPPDIQTRKPNFDNLFLTTENASAHRFLAIAIDHTHCFNCGRDLTTQIRNIDIVRDDRVYGAFPEFSTFVTPAVVSAGAAKLRTIDRQVVQDIVNSLPSDWEVPTSVRAALVEFVVDRAAFVADTLPGKYPAVAT
jgi:hypothetical protein